VTFAALGTTATVVVTESAALARARALVEGEVAAIDEACSRFRTDSDLARANAAAGRRVRVSRLLCEAVRVAVDAAAATNGIVSPVLGRALRAAGYDRTFRLVRDRERWAFVPVAVPHDAWRHIELDVDRTELVVPEGVELDLGATAKALAADRAATAAASATGAGVLVSLGGDIAVAGVAPAGAWPVRIAEDHAAPLDGPGQVVAIVSGGLATSSTTVRRWRTDSGEAHHILDPRSGLPAPSTWRTVTAAASTCVAANVAATAAVVLADGAVDWLVARGVPARLVSAGGTVATVCGWPRDEGAA
jgi:thiamine biosynthesis lipoprotein